MPESTGCPTFTKAQMLTREDQIVFEEIFFYQNSSLFRIITLLNHKENMQ